MDKEVGNKEFSIWLLGDSNPSNWQDVLVTPLDPRHPARHSIWTPVLDVMQDRVFRQARRRIDTSMLYIRNAIEDPRQKPLGRALEWKPELNQQTAELGGVLQRYHPPLLLCFGAFSFEFARRALGQQPQRVYNYWGARTLGAEFRRRLEDFKVDQVNALPLLHTSISRGRFVESHQYFSGQTDGNYFEYVGQALADRLLEHSADLPIWIE